MTRTLAVCAVTAVLLFAPCRSAMAQEVTADVRTWDGQVLRLAEPRLEIFYSILPGTREVPSAVGVDMAPEAPTMAPGVEAPRALPEAGVPAPAPTVGAPSEVMLSGSVQALSTVLGRAPEPRQGRRQRDSITLITRSVERYVPVASIAVLTFSRQPVPASPLPPYVAPTHFRYGATAQLVDGSRVDGDYVNLGTTILRGVTPHGLVDVPWEQIEMVRFTR